MHLHWPGDPPGAAALREWVQRSADAVAAWYGTFPVRTVDLRFAPAPGRGLHGAVTYGGQAPHIDGRVGRDSDLQRDLLGDWVLVHELVHLALPDVPGPHRWLEEGLATYVEPWVRVAAGQLDLAKAWRDLVDGLPQGLPGPGDQGLDRTATWGRTYWGGALFCLLGDLEIRRRTADRAGLQHALRGVLAAGGSLHVTWPIEQVLATADAATGTTALTDLWAAQRDTPVLTDLEALWRALGVVREGRSVRFDDTAPLAARRRAIAAGPTARAPSR
ncbi:MAG: hypothetical protein R3F59_30145 [Myxococcota bacterium]